MAIGALRDGKSLLQRRQLRRGPLGGGNWDYPNCGQRPFTSTAFPARERLVNASSKLIARPPVFCELLPIGLPLRLESPRPVVVFRSSIGLHFNVVASLVS